MALLSAVALLAVACSSSAGTAAEPGGAAAPGAAAAGTESVRMTTVELPAGTQPELPSFTADGQHLVFDYSGPGVAGHQLATVALDGSDFRCVTCSTPGLDVGKAFVSRDDRRVLVRSPGGKGSPAVMYGYDIIDCADGVLACTDPTLVPLQLPGRSDGVLQTRELRLSPDGQHVAFSQVRAGGWTMVMGTLARVGDHYELTDLRLLSPSFDLGDAAADWAAAGAFYEVKGFAADGRSVIYAATRDASLNYDDYELDLETGQTRRLTTDDDWDEPLDVSPDGTSFVVGSSRGTHRIDAMSQLVRPPFFDMVAYAQTARWLLTTDARDCLVRPWLFTTADGDTSPPGQELDGEAWAEGYGPRAIPSFSRDGTRIVFWEELQDPSRAAADAPTARLRVATLVDRAPIAPTPAVATPVPTWALTYDQYLLSDRTANQTVRGAAAGTATLDFRGSFTSGAFRVTYQGYSDDGRTFLDGTEAFDNGSILSSGAYEVDLRSTGAHEGSMTGRIAIDGTAISGSITSIVDGNELTWPPPACPPPTTG